MLKTWRQGLRWEVHNLVAAPFSRLFFRGADSIKGTRESKSTLCFFSFHGNLTLHSGQDITAYLRRVALLLHLDYFRTYSCLPTSHTAVPSNFITDSILRLSKT